MEKRILSKKIKKKQNNNIKIGIMKMMINLRSIEKNIIKRIKNK